MQRAILSFLISLAVMSVCFATEAEQSLTISLDIPQAKEGKGGESDLRLNHETLGTARQQVAKQVQNPASQKASSGDNRTTVGRVGTVTSAKAEIRSYPGTRGRVLYTCAKDAYLAVIGYNGDWYAVLMIDSSTGWIHKKHVNLLDYQFSTQTPLGSDRGNRVVQTALKYLGISYRWGGYSTAGLDCSGFVKAVFASNGVELPRVSRDQAVVGASVPWNQLQPGDRLYFACKADHVDHTGIYMGNGYFIHSSASRGGVAVDSINKPFWLNSLVVARRS